MISALRHDLVVHAVEAATSASSSSSTLNLVLPENYGFVLLAACILGIELVVIGFIFPGGARKEFFSQKFMEDNFGEIHRKAFNEEISQGGYPDMGGGYYSNKLTYQHWYKFNNAQRVHQNFVEWLPAIVLFLFVAGIHFPLVSAILGAVLCVARIVYSAGYVFAGPSGRSFGATVNHICVFALFAVSVVSCVFLIIGKPIAVQNQ